MADLGKRHRELGISETLAWGRHVAYRTVYLKPDVLACRNASMKLHDLQLDV